MCVCVCVYVKGWGTRRVHPPSIILESGSENPLQPQPPIIQFLLMSRVGISGTTAKSRIRKFVPSSHPGPFGVVATSRKSQTKVGTLACFDLL